MDPSLRLARAVLMPALRWDGSRYRPEGTSDDPSALVASGVAGFIVFGGTADAVARLTHDLRRATTRPLLFGADLERGAGQQFDGATALPPAGAFGSIDDLDVTRAAGELTAREARALGIDIVFAPVADVASVPDNPIVGPRAFGPDPEAVARHVRAWVEGALRGGAFPCVKHFPGHGRTSGDSHVDTVVVYADVHDVRAELAPFRAAVDAGVPVVMPGHLMVPALDPTGRIATTSSSMLHGVLRGELGFDGVVVSDAMLMAGAGDLSTVAIEALGAGMDLLIYPESLEVADEVITAARERDPEFGACVDRAARRVRRLAVSAAESLVTDATVGREIDEARARRWALASVERVRGGSEPPGPTAVVRVIDIDDDVGGPYPPPARDGFRSALSGVDDGAAAGPGSDEGSVVTVVALWADTRGWKGRAGLSRDASRKLGQVLDEAPGPTHVVVFGGPRVVADVPDGPTVWLAWGGEATMQHAAAARLRARDPGGAST